MHAIIRLIAFYASATTVVSALIFIAYLEIYSYLRGDNITSGDDISWSTIIPKIAVWTTIAGGLTSAIATLLTIAGL
jgi:hypothetical protein